MSGGKEKYGKLSKDAEKQLVSLAMQRDNSFGPKKALATLEALGNEFAANQVSGDSIMALLIVAVAHCNAPARIIKSQWLKGVKLPKGFIILGRNGMSHNFNNTAFHSLGEVVMYIFQDDIPHFKEIVNTSGLSITQSIGGMREQQTDADKIRAQRRVKNKPEWDNCLATHATTIANIRTTLSASVISKFVESETAVDMGSTIEIVPKSV